MSTVVPLNSGIRKARLRPPAGGGECEIVIFPGVRIERHELDLGHRVRDALGGGGYDDLDGSRGRRKSS